MYKHLLVMKFLVKKIIQESYKIHCLCYNFTHTLNLSLFFLSSSGVVNVEIEHGILQWDLHSGLSEQVSAYHVLVYKEGHRMESPPMWVTRRVYNLSNLHLAAGTYYIEVSIGSSHWRVYIV